MSTRLSPGARSTQRHLAAAAIGALATFLVSAPAGAQETPEPTCETELDTAMADHVEISGPDRRLPDTTVTVCGYTADLPQFDSLANIATSQGMPLREVIDRYSDQEAFVDLANDLRERYPDDYAGAEYAPGGGSWIAFREQAPSFAATATEAEFRVIEDKGYSEAELSSTLQEAFMALTASDSVESAMGDYDLVTGVIDIQVAPAASLSATSVVRALETTALPEPATDRARIEISVDESLTGGAQQITSMRGGGDLDLNTPGGGVAHCTSAFGVKKPSGLTGILTAHHCAATYGGDWRTRGEYRHWNGDAASEVVQLWQAYSTDQYTDSAAYYAWDGTGASCWFNNNDGWTSCASDLNYPVKGQWLQVYGQVSGRGESQVKISDACYKYPDVNRSYCGLTVMNSLPTQGGDSGGPWFDGSTAYGIHSGWGTSDGQQVALFSQLVYALDELTFELIT